MQGEQIGPYDACGAYPIRGLLLTARRLGWQAQTARSAEFRRHVRRQVTGGGLWRLRIPLSPRVLAPAQRADPDGSGWTLDEHGLATGRPLTVVPRVSPRPQGGRASFVTLQLHGMLRGCIGHLEAVQPLVVDVAETPSRPPFRTRGSAR